MKTITFSSIKGGVGKTSTLTLLAQLLAAAGKKILLVDLDIQNSLTFQFLREFEQTEEMNIARALTGGKLADNILPSEKPGIDICSSHFQLTALRTINPWVLGNLIGDIKEDYDYCLIDTSPNFDNHVLSSWLAADRVISPTRLGLFDYKGMVFMLDQMILESGDWWKDHWSLFFNFYRSPRTGNSPNAEYQDIFSETFADQLLPYSLPDTTLIRKAVDYQERISQAKSKRRVHSFFTQLAHHISDGELSPQEVYF